MVTVKNGDELAIMLTKALQIEEGIESVVQWEAYVSAKNYGFRKIIFDMFLESEKNKSMIEEMLIKVKITGTHKMRTLKPHVVDFSGRQDQEVMDELYHVEILMLNTYTLIHESLMGVDLDHIIDPQDQGFFLTTLSTLISNGEEHAAMASTHRGSVHRIR
ncbi:MAG: hypothetical protein ABR986_09890 [Methanomassiliicoccales archaeon]|jgi:hypothetical protein